MPRQPLRRSNPMLDKERTCQTTKNLSEKSTILTLKTISFSLTYSTLFEIPYIFITIYYQQQQQHYLLSDEGLHQKLKLLKTKTTLFISNFYLSIKNRTQIINKIAMHWSVYFYQETILNTTSNILYNLYAGPAYYNRINIRTRTASQNQVICLLRLFYLLLLCSQVL